MNAKTKPTKRTVYCESAELAGELLSLVPTPSAFYIQPNIPSIIVHDAALIFQSAPSYQTLISLKLAHPRLLIAVLGETNSCKHSRTFAEDLGFTVARDLPCLLALIALSNLSLTPKQLFATSTRMLNLRDQACLEDIIDNTPKRGFWRRIDAINIGWQQKTNEAIHCIAQVDVLAHALRVIKKASALEPLVSSATTSTFENWNDTLFGPKRTLSNQTTQLLLHSLNIPVASSQTVQSASHAYRCAKQLGFPVRLSLAAHPEVEFKTIDSANELKHAYEELVLYSQTVFGTQSAVTLAHSAEYKTRLWCDAFYAEGTILFEFGGFHFSGERDVSTIIIAPEMSDAHITRALSRLRSLALTYKDRDPALTQICMQLVWVLRSLTNALVRFQGYIEAISLDIIELGAADCLQVVSSKLNVSDKYLRDLITVNANEKSPSLKKERA